MRTSNQEIDGDIVINYPFQFHGMIKGNATVVSGGNFVLHGTCCRNLLVKPGSIVHVHGTIIGNVFNDGGQLEIYGTVGGSLYSSSSQTFVAEGSMIGGQRINSIESQSLSHLRIESADEAQANNPVGADS
jgi:cytoskeletal protein CcmA (bactofilin family)